MKKRRDTRPFIQGLAALLANSHLVGFFGGKISIYKGKLKSVCLPGLNCYSCPGAVGSCPIGSLQAVIGGHKHNFSFYVIGTMALFGMLLGRAICGLLCLFGFLQDLLYKIPTPKLTVPHRIDRPLRYLKYLMLVVLVILLPMLVTNLYGIGAPAFCKWVCPAGMLEGGIPLVASDAGLQKSVGFLFYWKLSLLIFILLASVFIHRPFCKYLCPLGAFYGLFSKVGLWRMQLDKAKCVDCGLCEQKCPMQVAVRKDINVAECIRCGACKKACPTGAIRTQYGLTDKKPKPSDILPDVKGTTI